MLVLFGAAILFQLTVLFGLVPTEMVWGGRLENAGERTAGAVVSITVLLVAGCFVLIRMKVIGKGVPAVGRWGLWRCSSRSIPWATSLYWTSGRP